MKKVIPLLLALSALSLPAVQAQDAPGAPSAAVRPFPDVPPGHWAAAAVERLHQLGIVRGYPAQAPSQAAHAPTMGVRAAGAQGPRRR